MIQRFHSVLRGNGFSATCIVEVDSSGAQYLPDDEVNPRLPDGEYDLEVNGIHKRAIRTNGEWKGFDY